MLASWRLLDSLVFNVWFFTKKPPVLDAELTAGLLQCRSAHTKLLSGGCERQLAFRSKHRPVHNDIPPLHALARPDRATFRWFSTVNIGVWHGLGFGSGTHGLAPRTIFQGLDAEIGLRFDICRPEYTFNIVLLPEIHTFKSLHKQRSIGQSASVLIGCLSKIAVGGGAQSKHALPMRKTCRGELWVLSARPCSSNIYTTAFGACSRTVAPRGLLGLAAAEYGRPGAAEDTKHRQKGAPACPMRGSNPRHQAHKTCALTN